MNQKLAIIIFAFAFMVAIVAGFYSPERDAPAPAAAMREKWQDSLRRGGGKPPAENAPLPLPTPKESTSFYRSPASVAPSPKVNRALASGIPLEDFTRKYGDRLSFTRAENRVVRVSGIAIPIGELSVEQRRLRFRSANAKELVARAREIFHDARALLGIPDDVEFMDPVSTPGESSGQVIYQQSKNGVPVYPGGLVTILVGAEGELRTLDSSVYPEIEIANQPSLPVPAGSRPILFVIQSAPIAVVKHAYETQIRGVLSVQDAATGEILLERSRRVH